MNNTSSRGGSMSLEKDGGFDSISTANPFWIDGLSFRDHTRNEHTIRFF